MPQLYKYLKLIVLAFLLTLGFSYQSNAQCTAVINTNVTPAEGCDPFTIQLFDQSTGFTVNRVWNFGDGSASSGAQNPIHTFTSLGRDTTYNVLLKTYCLNGDSSTASLTVTVFAKPKVDFVVDTTVFCALSDTACFTNLSDQGTGFSYLWSFGDNTSSAVFEPCKVYPTDGVYTVALTVTDEHGCQNTETKTNYVSAQKAPNPDFSLVAFTGCSPFNAQITNTTNTTTDSIASWSWNFGDGTPLSNLKDPLSHNYLLQGTYVISLQATNTLGCSNNTTRPLIVRETPVAGVSAPIDACKDENLIINFNGSADSTIATYLWDFSGANINSGSNQGPYQISYSSPGNYTVSVTVTQNACSSSTNQSIQINQLPLGFLTNNVNDSACFGANIIFTAQPGNYDNYNFMVDGVTVQNSSANQYSTNVLLNGQVVSVAYTDLNGCTNSSTSQNPIIIKPNPQVSLLSLNNDTICQGDTAWFVAQPDTLSSYTFLNGFSPIQISGSDTLVVVNVQADLNINVNATYMGCQSNTDSASTAIVIKRIVAPTVNCGATTDTTITFMWDAVNDAEGYQVSINGQAFTFPSSGVSGLQHFISGLNPNDSATIQVLPLGNGRCGNGFISTTLTCVAQPCDLIDFQLNTIATTICEGSLVDADITNITPVTFQSNWMNSGYGTNTNFSLNVVRDTTISVSVKNTVQFNCPAVTKNVSITVVETPDIILTSDADSVCSGTPVNFTASPVTYSQYTFLNGFALLQNSASPYLTANLSNANNTISVIGTTNGCSDTAVLNSSLIIINPLPAPQVLCGNTSINSITFNWDSIQNSTGYLISINGGNFTTPSSGSFGLTHTVSGLNPDDALTIIVQATGTTPCGSSDYSFSQTCYAKPCTAINFNKSNDLTVCEGDTVSLNISNLSINNFSTSWNGGALSSSLNYSFIADSSTLVDVSVKNNSELACPIANKYINVTVLQNPNVSLISTNDSVCFGSNITFTASPSGFDNYVFYNNFQSVQSSNNHIYNTSNLLNNQSIKVVAYNGTCADTSNSLNVFVSTPLSTPLANCSTTTTNSIYFTWDSVANANGYEISLNGGPFTTPSSGFTGTIHFINGLNANDSVTLYVRAIGNPPCGNSFTSLQATCYARNCTGINYSLNVDSLFCENQNINASISGLNIGNFETIWQNGSSGTLTSYTTLADTSKTIKVVVVNMDELNCPVVTKSQNVIVQPVVSASLNTTAASNYLCEGTIVNASASPQNISTYQFYLNGILSQTGANPAWNNVPLVFGTNELVVVPLENGCNGISDTVSLNYFQTPVLSFNLSGSPDSVCEGTPVTVNITPNNLSNYSFNYNGTVLQNNSNATLTFTPTVLGNGNQLIINAQNSGGCTNNADTLNYTVIALPVITLNSSANDSICIGQNVTLTASPAGIVTYGFYLNNSVVQSSSSNTYTSANLQTGDSIKVIAINSFNCASTASTSFGFTIKPTYKPLIDADDSVAVCLGSSYSLSMSVNPPVSGITYSWSTGETTQTINVNPTVTTTYLAFTNFGACPSLPDTVTVEVDDQPLPIAEAGDGSTICKGDSIKLIGSGGQSYYWYNTSGDLLGSGSEIYVKPLKDETFHLTAMNLACTNEDTVRISVDRCLKDITGPIPQIISPNGDSANDNWIVPDVDYFTLSKVVIYNRWGNVVWQAEPYLNNWNGVNEKGTELPDGTYYYVLNLNNGDNKVYNGFVVIHR